MAMSVTTAGLNKFLDATLKTGLASPAWYVGLVGAKTTGYAAGDTLASHGGWTESTDYADNRKAFTPGTIASGSVDNDGNEAVFAMNDTVTINGAFMCDAATGTSGTLLGEGDFAAAKNCTSGDTLTVTVTATLTST